MKKISQKMNVKQKNRSRVGKFISSEGNTSKGEIAKNLHLSMPTALQIVKELTELGIVVEEGEYQSTGGRKAKVLSIARTAGYAAGVDITNNHITWVMVNARKEIVASRRIRRPYGTDREYNRFLEEETAAFLKETKVPEEKILGVGFSLPGIVDKEKKILLRSHTLKVENVSFQEIGEAFGYPYILENDANSAAEAEIGDNMPDAVYLSLSNTVGGAIYMDHRLYEGKNFKSAEFGHMILEPGGRKCYCGKRGCLDAYCRAGLLSEAAGTSLDVFFALVRQGDAPMKKVWEEYLEHLAVAVSNLRMAFDCDVVLGGYVGGYMEEFMADLSEKIQKLNIFDKDTSYLHGGKYKLEASAYGAALYFIRELFETSL